MCWFNCKDVLCLGLNPKCLSRISPHSLTTCKIVANRIFSNSLSIVSQRIMVRLNEGSAGFFPGLRIGITRACFHTLGKWWVRRTTLEISARRESARWGPVRVTFRSRSLVAPVGREEMDVRNQRVSSTHAWRGRWSRRSEIYSSGKVEVWMGTTWLGVVGLAATVLTLAAAFFYGFPVAGLGAVVDFGSGFSGLAVLLVAVTISSSGASVTGWEGGFVLGLEWGWLWRHAPSDDVIPPLARVHLLARGHRQLRSRSGRVFSGDALLAEPGCFLCRNLLLFFSLKTATVFRHVVSPAATALRLFPRGRVSTGQVGAATCNTPGCVSAVTLHLSKALAARALQWVFWSNARLHRHWQAVDFGEWSHFRHLCPSHHWYNEEWAGGPWRGPGRDGQIAGAWLWRECSGIRAPVWPLSQAYPYPCSSPEVANSGREGAWSCGNSQHPLLQGTSVRWLRLWNFRAWWDDHQFLAV